MDCFRLPHSRPAAVCWKLTQSRCCRERCAPRPSAALALLECQHHGLCVLIHTCSCCPLQKVLVGDPRVARLLTQRMEVLETQASLGSWYPWTAQHWAMQGRGHFPHGHSPAAPGDTLEGCSAHLQGGMRLGALPWAQPSPCSIITNEAGRHLLDPETKPPNLDLQSPQERTMCLEMPTSHHPHHPSSLLAIGVLL